MDDCSLLTVWLSIDLGCCACGDADDDDDEDDGDDCVSMMLRLAICSTESVDS